MQFDPKLSPASLSSSACRTFRHGEFGNYGKTLPAKLLPKLLINSIVLCFWFMFYSQRIKNQTKFYGKLHYENADHLEMRTISELNSGHWVALPICNLANGKLITRDRAKLLVNNQCDFDGSREMSKYVFDVRISNTFTRNMHWNATTVLFNEEQN